MALPINVNELLHGKTIEWDRIELKKGWNPEDIIHSLCAYANDISNWDGGYIIIGVEEENGTAKLPPFGLEPQQIDSIQKRIIELSYKISPSYVPVSQPYIKDGHHILIIWAPAGDNRPYKAPVSLSEKKVERAYYIKRGSKTIKVKSGSDDERRLLELTARIPFDDRINQHSALNDLSLHLIQEHLKEVMSSLYDESTKISFADLCKQMKIAKGPDELLRPTNAGLLMFNESPDKFFAGAKIEIVVHKGKVGKDYSENIFTGSIVKQLRDALSFIKTNIIHENVSKASQQAEAIRYYNYPYQAIEEALVNAVYHRSYERENPVEVQIFLDRIEILSFPGPMPPVNKNMLKKERVVSREYRNRKLGGFLKELKLTEGRGTGLPIIYRSLEENGSPPPIFETDDDLLYFLSIIRIHPLTQKESIEEKDVETSDNVSPFNSLKEAILYLRSSDNQNATKDNKQIISILRNIASYLRSVNDQRLTQEVKQNRNKEDLLFVKTLMYCYTAKTREEIFKHIEIYNNSRNFNDYIKPVIELDWLQYTIPDKPTSKNQKYITAPYVIKWIEEDKIKIKRTPVASSNIASVGYDAEKQILEIEFQHGAIYQYLDVPKEVYDRLMNAPSIGSYFMHNFKNKFKSQKI